MFVAWLRPATLVIWGKSRFGKGGWGLRSTQASIGSCLVPLSPKPKVIALLMDASLLSPCRILASLSERRRGLYVLNACRGSCGYFYVPVYPSRSCSRCHGRPVPPKSASPNPTSSNLTQPHPAPPNPTQLNSTQPNPLQLDLTPAPLSLSSM